MAVLLIVSEAVTGAEVADVLSGGSTGQDYGQVTSGSYAPVIDQPTNDGSQDMYLRHDATIDPITDVSSNVAVFTGTYGGANSAAADFTTLGAYGAADAGATANNGDGLSRGLHMDMDWQVSVANQFQYSREATGQKRIYGKDYSGLTGLSLALAFPLHADACSYWNGVSEVDATTPVTGQIGISTDAVLGNRGHVKDRFYLNSGATEGGVLQFNRNWNYSFTA